MAECEDGALVYARAAHLSRMPAADRRERGRGGPRGGGAPQGRDERLVAAAQNAYAACGDWRDGPMIHAMRSCDGATHQATEGEMKRAVGEARRRWQGGPPAMRAVTLNHGGCVTRLREAVEGNRRLRKEAERPGAGEAAALVWQSDGRLYRTMRTMATGNEMVLVQETHLPEGEAQLRSQLTGLLTQGEYSQWGLEESPAPADDPAAGVMVWYDKTSVEVTNAEEKVPGRMQWMQVRVLADGTKFDLVNVYVPARAGAPTAAQARTLVAVREELQAAADRADATGRELLVAGDVQAQTMRALNAKRATRGNEYDAWMHQYTAQNCLESVGEVADTYTAGEGGATTAIDHWLASVGLADRATTEVGAGADGMWTGVEGEEQEEAIGREGLKGHNSLQLTLRLRTAVHEEAEEEWAEREQQLPPMDAAEWEVYLEEEEARIAGATGAVQGTGFGTHARRLEAAEAAAKALVKEIKEIGGAGRAAEEYVERKYRQMLRWRKWMKMCDAHPAYPDTHRMFNAGDCGGAFGGAVAQGDEAMKAVVEGSEGGARRRAALREECRKRYLAARSAYEGKVAEGAEDEDRVRTRLLQDVKKAQERGGLGQWEFFRAIGRAKAALAGKQTQPREGKPGMVSIKRTGHAEPVSGKGEVLRAIQEESQRMHQEGGASEAAMLGTIEAMESDGVPLIQRHATRDVREDAEREQERSEAQEAAREMAAAWQAWEAGRERQGEEGTLMDSLEGEAYEDLARGLQRCMGRVLTDEALEEGMGRFREVQGVGKGGFSGVWIAKASKATRQRYMQSLRGA